MPPLVPARRTRGVEYAIRDIAAAARRLEASGRRITYLNIGDPGKFDFAPPPHVVEAYARAARDPACIGYAPGPGIPELREAIARREGVDPADAVATSAASDGIQILFAALLDPGDDVLLPSPCYPLYTAIARLFDAEPNFYRCNPATWEPDLADVDRRVTPRTRALVVIDPNNPTGAVYSEATLRGLVEAARRRGLPIFLDRAYDGLTYEPRAKDLMGWRGDVPVIVAGSMSKVYFFPGTRCGYLAFHGAELADLRDACLRLCQARLGINQAAQRAFLAALTGPNDHLAPTIARLRARGEIAHRRLNAIPGISCVRPRAAFYVFPAISRGPWTTDRDFVMDLLQETGILTVHGSGFAPALGGRYFRIVHLLPEAELEAAFDALAAFMDSRTR